MPIEFDNLLALEDGDMQVLLRSLRTETMAVALQGASMAMKAKFIVNIAEAARPLLAVQIASGLHASAEIVAVERAAVLNAASSLAAAGRIRGSALSFVE